MKKNLFEDLPADIQREVCWFLVYKDIKKLGPKFYDNPNDVYWKMKMLTVTDEKKPFGKTYRNFYESFVYEKFLKSSFWDYELLEKMAQDEIFLTRHINARAFKRLTALMFASMHRKEEIVKTLLTAGANVNRYDYHGGTALMYASTSSTNENIVKLLLAAGANVNNQDLKGWSALMYAAVNNNIEIIKLLLDAGADINHASDTGMTALMASVHDSKIDSIKFLLTAGADVTLQTKKGCTALSYARTDEIRRLLMDI